MTIASPSSRNAAWRRIRSSLGTDAPLPLVFAAFVVCGCLVALSSFAHLPTGDAARMQSLPFIGARGAGVDFYQFWIVGQTRDASASPNIYADQERERMARVGRGLLEHADRPSPRLAAAVEFRPRIETFSTPFLYAVFGLLTGGEPDYETAFDRFLSFSVVCGCVSIVVLALGLRYRLVDALLWVAVLALWSEPASSDWRVGNVNVVQLAGVSAYLASLRIPNRWISDAGGGALLGLLVAFKPTLGVVPLVLAASWVIERRWRTLAVQAASACGALVAAAVVGSVFLGSASVWIDWAGGLSRLAEVSNISVRMGNFSLAEWVDKLAGADGRIRGVVSSALLVVSLATTVAILYRGRRRVPSVEGQLDGRSEEGEKDAVVASLACAISVLSLSLAWPHYFLLLTPLAMVVLRPLACAADGPPHACGQGALSWFGLAGLVAILGRPLAILAGWQGGEDAALPMIVGAWALFAAGAWHLWNRLAAGRVRP